MVRVTRREGKVYWGRKVIGGVGLITADSNEVQHHPALRDAIGVLWYGTVRLPAGDYLLPGKDRIIGVERKTLTDLLSTFSQKVKINTHHKVSRLGNQLQRLLEAYDEGELIIELPPGRGLVTIEGYYQVGHRVVRVLDSSLWGFLDNFQARGLRVRLTTGLERTVSMMGAMLRSANRPRSKENFVRAEG